jgi:hypothetical protein
MLHTTLRTAEPGDFPTRQARYEFMTAKLPPRPKQPHRGTHAAPVRRANSHPAPTTGTQVAALTL